MMVSGRVIGITWVACAVLLLASAGASSAAPEGPQQTNRRLITVEAELDAQREARDRQADAFDAAVSRIESMNQAMVIFLAVAGLFGGFLAIRWVRSIAREQVAAQIDSAIRAKGEEIFEAESRELREEYEAKFADEYKRYKRLTER